MIIATIFVVLSWKKDGVQLPTSETCNCLNLGTFGFSTTSGFSETWMGYAEYAWCESVTFDVAEWTNKTLMGDLCWIELHLEPGVFWETSVDLARLWLTCPRHRCI